MIESLEAQGLQLAKEKQEYLGRKLFLKSHKSQNSNFAFPGVVSVVKPSSYRFSLDEAFE